MFTRKHARYALPIALLLIGVVSYVPASVILAVIPGVVPVANKRGNSNFFALASSTSSSAAGTGYCDDGSGNLTTAGCNFSTSGVGESISSTTPVTVSANTTSDQTLIELAPAAGYFNSAGQPFSFFEAGLYTTALAQIPTLQFKIKLCIVSGCGSGTVVTLFNVTSTATTAAASNNQWNIAAKGVTVTVGASGTLEFHGNLTVDLGGNSAVADSVFADTNTAVSSAINLTAALFVDVTVATSSGNTGNSITQRVSVIAPFAAVAAPVTSVAGLTGAVPGQGTDTKVLTSGTVSGTGSSLCTDAQGGATTSGCTSGGSAVASTTFASLPGTCTSGNLYLFTNSAISSALCGPSNTYTYFMPPFGQVTPPVLANFTAVNTPTTSGANGGIVLTAPQSGSDNVRLLVQAVPVVAYTMTACFITSNPQVNYLPAGIALYDGTKIVFAGAFNDSPNQVISTKYTNFTTFSAAYAGALGSTFINGPLCMRIQDNGTNRLTSYSLDGVNFVQFLSVSRTDFLTPTQVGLAVDSNNGTYGSTAWFVHYLVTTP